MLAPSPSKENALRTLLIIVVIAVIVWFLLTRMRRR
jgi:preprotein translocase subunit YajC